tara:strand:- start:332 stop:754 length:423 start_codon:yes stop_codon:yes gene_type:complete
MNTLTIKRQHLETFISSKQLIELLNISPRTARHYCANPEKIPDVIYDYLVVLTLGVMPGFKTVRICNGKIMLNTGVTFNEHELHAFGIVYQERNALRQKLPLLNHNNPPDEFREPSDVQNGPNNGWRVHSLYKRIFKKSL